MLIYILNDSEDDYARTSNDFDDLLIWIGQLINDSFDEMPKTVKFTSEKYKWQWSLQSKSDPEETRVLQLLFSKFGCIKGKDCCKCEFKCANCHHFYGDHDNNDYRCLAHQLEDIDGLEITCMDCQLYVKPNSYPRKDMPKFVQKSLCFK